MITFRCSECRQAILVPADSNVSRARCDGCGRLMPLPSAVEATAVLRRNVPLAPVGHDVGRDAVVTSADMGDTFDDADFLLPPRNSGELGYLGPYRILRELGSGGMGVVFLAEDVRLLRPVALKAMRPAIAASPAFREQFLREARAAAAVRHERIVAIHQVGQDRGVPYLAMEFLEGQSLEDRLTDARPIDVGEALRIAADIADGLAAAHQRGLIHRDIKPSNLWLDAPNGRVKILDFGLACRAGDGQLSAGECVMGTPGYIAPEQLRGEAVDSRCDLFSLGCVLYRMLTGRSAYPTRIAHAIDLRPPEPPSRADAAIVPALSELVMTLLAPRREDRPTSARIVAERLRRMRVPATRKIAPASTQIAPRLRRPPIASPLLLVALLAGLGGLIALGGVLTFRTANGTVVIKTSEPDVRIVIDGEERLRIDSKKVGAVELTAGPHHLAVKQGNDTKYVDSFQLKSGAEVVIDATWTPAAEKTAEKPAAALAGSAKAQVDAVIAELKSLNPDYDGNAEFSEDNGAVTGLSILVDHVADVAPIGRLAKLRILTLTGTWPDRGKLRDLTPLAGLRLSNLDIHSTQVADLTPLGRIPTLQWLDCRSTKIADLEGVRGMKLDSLDCDFNRIADLAPLAGMPMRVLICSDNRISSLAPLRGMPLIRFGCRDNPIVDLAPLVGMPLTELYLGGCKIKDLGPLRGLPLKRLECDKNPIADLTPLRDSPLTYLFCFGTEVRDLTPIKDLRLSTLRFDLRSERDLEIVRGIHTLDTINTMRAEQFHRLAKAPSTK
jgi:eukaryotic-like serine/threonine-protein kinase